MKYNMLFINGWASTPSIFAPLVEALKPKIDKALIVDWHDSQYSSVDRMDTMIHMLADTRPQRPTILVGWSSGTMPILSYLGSDKIHKSVSGAILFGATPRFINSHSPDYNFGWHKDVLEQMTENFSLHPKTVIDAFADKCMSKKDTERVNISQTFKACFHDDSLTALAKDELKIGLEFLAHSDVRMKVSKIVHPLLLIAGENDLICSLKCSKWIVNNTHNTDLHIVKNTGHAPHYFEPDICSEYVKAFFEELEHND
ncbi:alpha/beta fold hydrolase [Fusibacter sp. JL216-2]|uniref:alpha/beta fold hydrolase n=1 Tax=Fusibacter sp. JL216-2 TaxID=3071453 RepID=UPI003D334882